MYLNTFSFFYLYIKYFLKYCFVVSDMKDHLAYLSNSKIVTILIIALSRHKFSQKECGKFCGSNNYWANILVMLLLANCQLP